MRRHCDRFFGQLPITLVAIVLLAGCATEPDAVEITPGLQAFIGARIIDGTGETPIEEGVLIVRDGEIETVGASDAVEVPADAERIDATGRTIIPGLINTHGHVNDVKGLQSDPSFYTEEHVLGQLGLYARYGVTTVVSLGEDGEAGILVRDQQDTPELNRARLYVAGPVVTAQTPDDARANVNELVEMDVDLVKIRVDDNLGRTTKMSEAVYTAVIDQAHARGLRLAAHLYYLEDAKSLLRAGADLLAHSIRDQDVDEELIDLLNARDVCVCPTLMREVSTFVYESRPAFFDDPFFLRDADPAVLQALEDPARQQTTRESSSAQQYKVAFEVAKRNVKKLVDAGIRISFGTDTGPPGRFQGYFEQLELEHMVDAGLTPMQALVSATGNAADCMHLDRVGTLEPGNWADLIILNANPLEDIRNTREIDSAWIAGNRVPARD